jgi:hypothetical protein
VKFGGNFYSKIILNDYRDTGSNPLLSSSFL